MIRKPVASSNIASVSWDPNTPSSAYGTLEVAFHSGGVSQDVDAPVSAYHGLLSAGSPGTYVHSFIKNRYATGRVG